MSKERNDFVANDLWNRAKTIFMSSLRTDEERAQSERYFSMITSVALDHNIFHFSMANSFSVDLFQTTYSENLKKSFDLAGAEISMQLVFEVDQNFQPSIVAPVSPIQKNESVAQNSSSSAHFNSYTSTMPLNPYFTFDEFVKGASNSWAHAAAMGVVENPGAAGYNPLFIHGGTGLGKTHLMQAIGNALKQKNPLLSICYLTTEEFLNQYVNALKLNKMQEFRSRYRKADVLLVDDVQFLQNGKQFQEEFFNTFNALTAENKQIVMTSDVAPKNLPAIENRLTSRFQGGMVQEIESPNYETRLAILQKKAESMQPQIPQTAIKFIAENIKSHVRAMEGALIKVKIMVSMNPTETITNDMLTYQLRDFIEKEQAMKKMTIEEIQAVVAKKYNVSTQQILSSERTQSIVTPRQMAMYIARKYTTKSLQEIAKVFDKSHATILHGVKTIEKRLDVEEELRTELESMIAEFGLKPTDRME